MSIQSEAADTAGKSDTKPLFFSSSCCYFSLLVASNVDKRHMRGHDVLSTTKYLFLSFILPSLPLSSKNDHLQPILFSLYNNKTWIRWDNKHPVSRLVVCRSIMTVEVVTASSSSLQTRNLESGMMVNVVHESCVFRFPSLMMMPLLSCTFNPMSIFLPRSRCVFSTTR